MYSLIIPVYKNESSIPYLLQTMENINATLGHCLEVIFVVDGSPDRSYALLKENLPSSTFRSKLLLLSRNFGAYAAIRAGLAAAQGPYYAVMAADLQEPPELIIQFFQTLNMESVDVVFGCRESRNDPLSQKIPSRIFWSIYKKFVQNEMPTGGVDIFACNEAFKDQLLSLKELNSSLVGLTIWLGFKRKFIGYRRLERQYGKSAWGLKNKIKYAMDSLFAFSDLPIKLLYYIGIIGILSSTILAFILLVSKLLGNIPIPGYSTTLITILFFGALNSFGLGIIGSYVWRTFENTKSRPHNIVMNSLEFKGCLNPE